MRKAVLLSLSCAVILLAALSVLGKMTALGLAPARLLLVLVAALYALIALWKFPAAFFAPLLFISRSTDLPGALFGQRTDIKALPLCAAMLSIAIFLRLMRMAAEGRAGVQHDTFQGQGKGIAAFLCFAAIVALSYSYTPSPLYGSAKLASFLLVGGLMFFGPFVIFQNEDDVRHFAYGTALVALGASGSRAMADAKGVFWAHEAVTHIGSGQVIGMAIILLLYYDFVNIRRRRLVLIPCLLVLAAGLIASEVRGAILSLGIVLIASLFTRRRDARLISPRGAALGLVMVIAALLIVPEHWFQGGAARMFRAKTAELSQFVEQGSYSWSGSGGKRLIFFGAALSGIAEKPLLGWGVGGWSYYFFHSDIWEYPHNVFLEVAVEQGLIGLAAYLVLLLLAARAARKCFDERSGTFAFVMPLLAYIVLLTCSTGDIDDCRFIWFTCSLAFVAAKLAKPQFGENLAALPAEA